jgi:hypothetical protein
MTITIQQAIDTIIWAGWNYRPPGSSHPALSSLSVIRCDTNAQVAPLVRRV